MRKKRIDISYFPNILAPFCADPRLDTFCEDIDDPTVRKDVFDNIIRPYFCTLEVKKQTILKDTLEYLLSRRSIGLSNVFQVIRHDFLFPNDPHAFFVELWSALFPETEFVFRPEDEYEIPRNQKMRLKNLAKSKTIKGV